MNNKHISLQEINHQAISILCKEMGVINTIRFIQQYSIGSGNYTQERKEYFKNKSVKSIINEIKQMRKS